MVIERLEPKYIDAEYNNLETSGKFTSRLSTLMPRVPDFRSSKLKTIFFLLTEIKQFTIYITKCFNIIK